MSMPATRANGKLPSPAFLNFIEPELQRVEDVLHEELSSSVQTVFRLSVHILDAGGKRLRPSLVILSTRACQGDRLDRAVNIGAGMELIHMATLIHDDVIDGAESRRGQKTANSFWGNQVSVLAGDYMLAKATSLLARDGDSRVIESLADATVAMTEGEISQIESQGDSGISIPQYLAIIRAKTAEFISVCCRIGAILSAAAPDAEEALARYGLNLGLAFQITDDLLDFVGDPSLTGKPVGSDICQGKVTMPLILALEKASPADRLGVENIIRGDGAASAEIDFVRKLVEETGAVEGTREAAAGYVEQAVGSLSLLPPSQARSSLEDLAHHILTRRK